MAVFLDSAITEEAKEAAELGWVSGVTTNPVLLKDSGRSAIDVLSDLEHLGFKKIFYQLRAKNVAELKQEVQDASRILKKKLVLKIPPTVFGLQIASQLSGDYDVCITAVYSVAQAVAAREAGAQYVALYVNRAAKMLGDGNALVAAVVSALKGSATEILAASLKSTKEAEDALLAGAQHLTLRWDVLNQFLDHELTKQALEEFEREGTGLVRS